MIDYEKEFGKPGYAAGARQVQIAATFKIVYGWMCAGLALSGVVAWYTAASGLWRTVLGILIFTGLTMYDAQKVKQLAAAEGNMDSAAIHKVGRSEGSANMTKKTLAVVAITCLVGLSFAAQSKTYRDGQGRIKGTK